MAISYPLTMPLVPAPVSARMYIERNQVKSESAARLQQVQKNPGDRWVGTITLPLMTVTEAADWLGFFDALDGFVGTFTMRHPDYQAIAGQALNNTGRVKGASQSGNILLTDSWPINEPDLFKRGDVTTIGDKLRRITQSVGSDALGEATLDLSHPLYTAPADNTLIVTSSPTGIFRLTDGFVAPESDAMRNHAFSFAFYEALP